MKKIEELLESFAQNSLAENSGEEKSSNTRNEEMESGSSSGTRTASSGQRWRKLEILVFSGEDAYGWPNWVECYFQIRVMEEEKMQAILIVMEGRALSWF